MCDFRLGYVTDIPQRGEGGTQLLPQGLQNGSFGEPYPTQFFTPPPPSFTMNMAFFKYSSLIPKDIALIATCQRKFPIKEQSCRVQTFISTLYIKTGCILYFIHSC